MKYLLSIIVVFNSLTLRAQSQNGPMMLQLNVQDTIFYDVDFGELSVDLDASINNTTYQALDSLAEKIKNEMVKALRDYRLTSSIHPVDSAMEVIFYFNKLPVLKAQVSKSGELLTTVEKQSINFF